MEIQGNQWKTNTNPRKIYKNQLKSLKIYGKPARPRQGASQDPRFFAFLAWIFLQILTPNGAPRGRWVWQGFGNGLVRVWQGFGKGLAGVWEGFGRGLAGVWQGFGRGLAGVWQGFGMDLKRRRGELKKRRREEEKAFVHSLLKRDKSLGFREFHPPTQVEEKKRRREGVCTQLVETW